MGIEACTLSFGSVRFAHDFDQPKDRFVRTAHAKSLSPTEPARKATQAG